MDIFKLYILLLMAVFVACISNVNENGEQMKVCMGTNARMSIPSNRNLHNQTEIFKLRDRFTNCTHIDGNLEISWIEDPTANLDFLQHIREVTGYVSIRHVHVKNIIFPRLQVIHGRTLFKLNIYDEKFGLFVSYSQMDSLELPALRDIISGSVLILNNQNLCFIQTINWEEIITGPGEVLRYVYNFTFPEPACPKCHPTCVAGCWGEGAHNCQKFSKINCSPQCGNNRCFGPNPRDCCHSFCAGGCTGSNQNECISCRYFDDDGVCRDQCPPIEKYDLNNHSGEPNPDGKYAYEHKCVKNCPENLLKDNGVCVSMCSDDKTAKNGECFTCDGPCPNICRNTGIVHSGNIDSFRGCTIIDGNLEILDQTFNGYHQVYANLSFGPRFIKMHPDRLEVFSTLREVTGFINIEGNHEDFTDLSCLRNLEVIRGRQLFDTNSGQYTSLHIANTNLKSFELRSLKQISYGAIVIRENENLCFANEINWEKIIKFEKHEILISNNKEPSQCSKQH